MSDQLDAIARAAQRDGEAVGISVAIAHGDLVAARAYGFADRERGLPATPASVYPLASLSKQYWAVAIAQLGIDVDAPVADFLPEFPDRRVRVRDLMQQTSGLGDDHAGEDDVHFSDLGELAFPPGTWWLYSNRGSLVARRLVEQVSGKPWADYLRDRIAGPLGLDATSVCGDHVQLYEHGKRSPGENTETMRRVQFVCASVLDVVRFERSTDAPELAKLRAPVAIDGVGELPYGMFTRIVDLDGHRAYGHTGNFTGLSVAAFRFPAEDLTIAVLVNAAPKPGFRAYNLVEKIARAELGLPEPPATDALPPPELLGQIAGDYTVGPARGTVDVRAGRAHLVVRDGGRVLIDEPLAWRGGRDFVGKQTGLSTFLPKTGPARAAASGHRFAFDTLARRVEQPAP